MKKRTLGQVIPAEPVLVPEYVRRMISRRRNALKFRAVTMRLRQGPGDPIISRERTTYRGRQHTGGMVVRTLPGKTGISYDPGVSFAYYLRRRLALSMRIPTSRELVRVFGPDGQLQALIDPYTREVVPRAAWPMNISTHMSPRP